MRYGLRGGRGVISPRERQYRIITESTPGGELLEAEPERLTLVATLEVVVRDKHGTYLMLTYPDYTRPSPGDGRPLEAGGQWTLPYVPYEVEERPRQIDRIRKQFAEAEAKHDIKAGLRRYCEFWGLGRPDLTEVGHFIEWKRSYANPDSRQLYKILRFSPDPAEIELQNLADPGMRKGHVFLPIESAAFKRVTQDRWCSTHRNDESLYLRHPLGSNVRQIVTENEYCSQLMGNAIDLDADYFYGTHKGLLFCGDLASYGETTQFLGNEALELDEDDDHVARVVRDSAIAGFTRLFHEIGAEHVHTAGDGFICAVPIPRKSDYQREAKRFLKRYAEFLAAIERYNSRLTEYGQRKRRRDVPQLGSRVAIHAGEYRYGKVSLAPSMLPGFDGRDIITVARLEGALRELTKGSLLGQAAADANLKDRRHTVICSSAALDLTGRLDELVPTTLELIPPRKRRVYAKEARVRGDVYALHPSA